MRRRTKIIGALIALATLSGAECGSAGKGENPAPAPEKDSRSKCPDITFRESNERCFTIQTFAVSSAGPYDVYINIVGGNGAYPPHVPVAAGGWKHGVVYASGVKMTITVTMEIERPVDGEAFCSITDGSQLAKDKLKSAKAKGGAPYIAVCTLTTNQ